MKKFYVYVHVCPNGKRYVGCTTRVKPEYRWGRNGEGYKGQLFGKAVRKYGWSSITHEVFEVESEEEMYRKEIELISFYHSNDPEYGYNCSTGGECSRLGCRCSEEYREKLSKARKGKTLSEEHKRRISEAGKRVQKKVHSDPEYRKHLSEGLKGKPHKPFSEETKRRMSKAHRGKILSEEHRKHIASAMKGKPKPRIKIKLPDETILEITKPNLSRYYINKGKKFEYVS